MRYLVSFWTGGVFLGYVSVNAGNKKEAEIMARASRSHRGWKDAAVYKVTVEKI